MEEKSWCEDMLFNSSFKSGLNLNDGIMPRSYVFCVRLPAVMSGGISMLCFRYYVCFS